MRVNKVNVNGACPFAPESQKRHCLRNYSTGIAYNRSQKQRPYLELSNPHDKLLWRVHNPRVFRSGLIQKTNHNLSSTKVIHAHQKLIRTDETKVI